MEAMMSMSTIQAKISYTPGFLLPKSKNLNSRPTWRIGPSEWRSAALRKGLAHVKPINFSLKATCLASSDLSSIVLGVGVGLPCTVMECGDIIYRSTLPAPGPFHLTAGGMALAATVVAYLWATPGVAPGFWDMFLLAPIEQRLRPAIKKEDLVLGKKLGEGAYGTVYRASYANSNKQEELVVKRANEFGAVEIWMNERVRRACPSSCANFVHGFLQKTGKGEEFWLVWKFEGDSTLADIISSKDFPYNVEEAVLGKANTRLPRGLERENRIIRALMQQLLSSLQRLHATGIVHRDIKPQNIIFSQDTGLLKIIDLGAAADLRVGINYAPKEFLLDPRYAAPEQYIMSTQTPSAPPPPVAATLSPVLWQMNLPDRFDIYSAGLIYLQMCFPNLRNDSALITFNRQLKRCEYDLVKWRELAEKRGGVENARGFALLEMDGGHGWELLQAMVRFKGQQRISAGGALAHPFFHPGDVPLLQRFRLAFLRAAYKDNTELSQAFLKFLNNTAPASAGGGFTETQLQEMKEKRIKEQKKATLQRNALASALRLQRKISQTLNTSMGGLRTRDEHTRKALNWWNRWQA